MTWINLKTDLEENAEGMVLHVHGKGNKARTLPVPAKLASALRKRAGVWLFPGDVQGHCGVDYVAKRIKTVTGYPSHSLRRRFATCVYYRNGCNIVLVSRMLDTPTSPPPCVTSDSCRTRCATPWNPPHAPT